MTLPSARVAVCARPGAPADACLAALAAEGVADPLVVRLPRAGAWADARNAALEACTAEVLVLVEDDVVVTPGWRAALLGGFVDADVAVCGGPIAGWFPGGRPAWLGDGLLPAVGVWDGTVEPAGAAGPQRPALPPVQEGSRTLFSRVPASERTFHGGNVAFRAAALRGVGGFWPARGHRDARDFYGEEHHAQHALAEAGWAAAWAPDAVVHRAVGPVSRAAVLRRRFRSGARRTLVGEPRPPLRALRAALSAAAGLPVALARGEAAVAAERAARVAENAGVLLGGAVAHGDVQPTARRTAFDAFVPPPAPRRGLPTPGSPPRRALPALRPAAATSRNLRIPEVSRGRALPAGGGGAGAEPVVLLYHRVTSRARDPLGLCVTPEHFAAQVEVLRRERDVVPLAAFADGRPADGAVAITFDDGYHDNLPALRAAAVPATVFISTGHVADGRGFWWDVLDRLLADPAALRPGRGPLRVGDRAWPARTPAEREVARRHLGRRLQALGPDAIAAALREVAAWAGVEGDPLRPPRADRPLTPAELRELAALPGVEIGAHTVHHRNLATAPAAEQRAEIAGSSDTLHRWLGAPPIAFSYPFGVPEADFDATSRRLVAEIGFAHAVQNAPGPLGDRFAIPRRVVPDVDGATFARRLAG